MSPVHSNSIIRKASKERSISPLLPYSCSFSFFHFVSALSPYLSCAVPWAATRRELLQWSTKSSLFLSFLVPSLALMHTRAIYRMQCHSRNSQIAPCSERGSCNINALLLGSICRDVSLYLMLISMSSALWDAGATFDTSPQSYSILQIWAYLRYLSLSLLSYRSSTPSAVLSKEQLDDLLNIWRSILSSLRWSTR